MGYTKHHAIVVTSWDEKKIKLANDKAKEICGSLVSGIVEGKINQVMSFFIAPDGSKEGWEESKLGDSLRSLFIEWVKQQAYEDGSNSIDYAELFYGDDNGESEIVSHN